MTVELVKSSFWYLFKPRKVGWLNKVRRGVGECGGNCLKYLNRGRNRKERRGNKDFKKGGGKLGQGVGALKRGGTGTPLRTMHLNHVVLLFWFSLIQLQFVGLEWRPLRCHSLLASLFGDISMYLYSSAKKYIFLPLNWFRPGEKVVFFNSVSLDI